MVGLGVAATDWILSFISVRHNLRRNAAEGGSFSSAVTTFDALPRSNCDRGDGISFFSALDLYRCASAPSFSIAHLANASLATAGERSRAASARLSGFHRRRVSVVDIRGAGVFAVYSQK